jgi:histidyl-tRNA synthetase
MKIPPVKGTRDFYPADMARRNWIINGWKKVSIRNGFEEYDGPIFEYLKMYQIKSGDEIVEQLFSLKDRGDRDLAIRPEITPTLARMVNQQINSLPRPIKWFSVPRLCRAERPQKGRLREFFQWNIDIIGEDNVLADAEVIFTTVDYLRDVGLTSDDIKVKISSRKLLAAVLKKIGIPESSLDELYGVLDKKDKVPAETFREMLSEKIPQADMAAKVGAFMELKSFSDVEKMFGRHGEVAETLDELAMHHRWLIQMGVGDYCSFEPSIVRGLAYYTGIVFEVHDIVGDLRAICGGGRYDNLLRDFGGPSIPATGMGMGDCVLEILLRQKGLLGKQMQELDYFVVPVTLSIFNNKTTALDEAVKLTGELRKRGYSVEFSYEEIEYEMKGLDSDDVRTKMTKQPNLGKRLSGASSRNARKCIIIGDEFKENKLVVKNMASGEQVVVDVDEFLSGLMPKGQ